jgi:hypothetical protein
VGDADWAFPDPPFRVSVTVEAGLFPREGELARCPVDFSEALAEADAPRLAEKPHREIDRS